MFTQQYLENVMDGLTSLEECKRKSTVMKLHLDAKVENVDMLFGTTIETGYLDGANLRLQAVKLVQPILDIWCFTCQIAAMIPLVLESSVLLMCIPESLGSVMDGPKQIQKIAKENVTMTKLHLDALVDHASMLSGITTAIGYQAGVNLQLMGVLQEVLTQDFSCIRNVSMYAPSRGTYFNQKKIRTLVYLKGHTAFEKCY